MKVPKPRQLASGKWGIQLCVNRKRVYQSFETKEEAIQWAMTYKRSHSKSTGIQSDYQMLLSGIPQDQRNSFIINPDVVPTVLSELEMIDKMSGKEFEKYCTALLFLTGYFNGASIHTTRASRDFGADIIIKCIDGVGVSIQCKRTNSNVRVDAIQEVVASKKFYDTECAAVITNANFTPQAKELAQKNNVALLDRSCLIKLIELKIETITSILKTNQWEMLLKEINNRPKKRYKKP